LPSSAQTSFTRNEFVPTTGESGDDERLYHAMFFYGRRQISDLLVVERFAWLISIGSYIADSYFAD
jgi:hypothetical protein